MKKTFLLAIVYMVLVLGLQAQSVTVQMMDSVPLTFTPLAENAVRVVRGWPSTLPELTYVDTNSKIKVKRSDKNEFTTITLKKMSIEVNRHTGSISYKNDDGEVVLTEEAYQLTPSTVQGMKTHIARVQFDSPNTEHLYGLGQFQDGQLNVRGVSRRLTQVNTQISLPFYLSSRGYAVLWNNYGMTDWNPGEQCVKLERLSEGKKTAVDVTSTSGNRREERQDSHFEAEINLPKDDIYSFLLDVGQSMARSHNLVVDDTLQLINLQNIWLPPTTSITTRLTAGKHKISCNLTSKDNPTLFFSRVKPHTVLSSPVAENVNYTVFVGNAEQTISTYRQLTGQSPLPPAWMFGYVHCRERFRSTDEILANAQTFRDKQLPMDVMVQDWQWWGKYGWNAMRFDEDYYPNPKLLVDSLHNMGSHLMLSVWSKIDKRSEVGKMAESKGYYIPGTDWIDFFNPEAADFYWQNFSDNLLKPYGIDCWWQDAVEPENDDLVNHCINAGKWPGEVMRNTYPLMVSKVVYEGNMKDRPNLRTSILTRCASPGIQRYGSFVWSGDVGNDWQTFHHQVVAGLGVNAAGHPWWTYDAGGFFRPGGSQYSNKDYKKRFLRWLQISTFLPMMRVHGYQTDTEFWHFGNDMVEEARKQLELRYSLFPYIYSTAYEVTRGGTMMRPLIMDFNGDETAMNIDNQYMFGHSIMVGVPGELNENEMDVYFPQTQGGWYDYFTAQPLSTYKQGAGCYARISISQSKIPVFVKAGSILPKAQPMQTTAQYNPSVLDIRVFPGADAAFTLYEDDGVTTQNEQGQYSTIDMKWDDGKGILTIGRLKGSYKGMPKERTFRVSLLNGQPTTIHYNGSKKHVSLK